jgi:hypothetical protein
VSAPARTGAPDRDGDQRHPDQQDTASTLSAITMPSAVARG